jgi:hypothetical protein
VWICFNDAFVSAVQSWDNPKQLIVRARQRQHLQRLFPKARIEETVRNDYRFRVRVNKRTFADAVAKRAMAIDYGNFKDSVADRRLHDLYLDFWWLHRDYQEGRPTRRALPAPRVDDDAAYEAFFSGPAGK